MDEPANAHDSQFRLNLVMEQMPAILWTTDRELRFTSGMGRGLNALKLDVSALDGVSLYAYFRTEDPEFPPIAAHRRALKGDSVTYEFAWEGRTYETHVRPLSDVVGLVIGTIGLATDVTERKRAEEAFRERERQYDTILSSVHDGVYTVDTEGRFTFINEAIVKRSGRDREWFIGRKFDDVIRLEDRERVRKNFEQVLRGETVHPYELAYPSTTGQEIWVEVNTTPLRQDDRIVGVLGVSRSIGERKRLEKEILEISDNEQRRIGRDIHDGLGQHLTGISFMLQDLYGRLASRGIAEAEDVAKMAKLVGQAIAQSRDMARLLNPLELEENRFSVVMELLTEWIESTFGVRCLVTMEAPELVLEPSTSLHLYRITQEAIHNAIRHGKAQRIRIRLSRDQDHLSLSIEDDGLGIPSEMGERKGMGLRIMEYRAKMIRGVLRLSPRPEGGTVVSCLFPGPSCPPGRNRQK